MAWPPNFPHLLLGVPHGILLGGIGAGGERKSMVQQYHCGLLGRVGMSKTADELLIHYQELQAEVAAEIKELRDEMGDLGIQYERDLDAAVLAEREACAELAHSMTGARPREIAEAIRARTAKDEGE